MLTKPQAFYDNIHKQALGYQNPFLLKKAQRIKPTLYDGIVMSAKHVAMPVIDDEETLILEEETNIVPPKKTTSHSVETQKPELKVYSRKPKNVKNVVDIILWYLDSRCSKTNEGNALKSMNFVSKFLGTVRFGNDNIARIIGLGPELQCMTPTTSSLGLVPNSVSQQPCIPPNRDYWDHLFQPMFNEYFTPPPITVTLVQEVAASRAVDLADSPMQLPLTKMLHHQ
ncbi:hypothetical protein Tco_0291578, partial [Tanacetum coccineum]